MNQRLRRVLMALAGATAVAAATALVVIRVGRPLYYSDGERAYLGASAALRQAPMVLWSRPEPELELLGRVRGRVQELADGSFVYGASRDDARTELVRLHPRQPGARPEVVAALLSSGHDLAPSLSADGRTLYFASDRPHQDGGGYDVWCASVAAGEIFAPRPLPATINTHADETDPVLDPHTGELVFARRAEGLDARSAFALWTAPADGSAPARRMLTGPTAGSPSAGSHSAGRRGADHTGAEDSVAESAGVEIVIDREPALSADGRALYFMRQGQFGPPTLMRAWRHAGTFAAPVHVDIAAAGAALRSPAILGSDRELRLVDPARGLVYRSRATLVYPWWEGQAWLERLLFLALVLALLIWILLALGQRWRALDIVTWCLLASLLLHVMILLWLRGIEMVRRYQNPPPRLGEIEVTLVASGGAVEATNPSSGSELARELRFSGHEQVLSAELPSSAVESGPLPARATDAADEVAQPQEQEHAAPAPELADAAAALAALAARSAERAAIAVRTSPVEAVPSPAAEAARRAAARSDQAFEVQVPAAQARATPATAAAAVPGAREAPPPDSAPPRSEVRPELADAVDPGGVREGKAVPPAAARAVPAPALAARTGYAEAQRELLAPSASGRAPAPGSALATVPSPTTVAAEGRVPLATATPPALPPPSPALREDVAGPVVARALAAANATPPAASEPLASPSGAAPVTRFAEESASGVAVVAAPRSALEPTPVFGAAAMPRDTASLPPASSLAPPVRSLADVGAPGPSVRASAARVDVAGVSPSPLAAGEVQPAGASIEAAPSASPAAAAALPVVEGPSPVLPAPPIAVAVTRPEREARGPSASALVTAPGVALREGSTQAPASAIAMAATPLGAKAPGLVADAMPGLGLAGPQSAPVAAARSPASQAAAVAVTRGPEAILRAASAAVAAGRRDEASPSRAAGGPRVALRDLQGDGPPAAKPVAAGGPVPTAAPPAATAVPLRAALATVPRRALPDVGFADVARGILPPGSLLPLPTPLAAGTAGAMPIAAVPDLYRSRFGPQKVIALEAFGGSEETEAAVRKGLDYLASIQRDDGAWGRRRRMHDKYGEVWVGKSALCLLAFLGAGHTQSGDTAHAPVVRKALAWLLDQQDRDSGHFGETSAYSHGITTYALAECYAMTKDARLRAPVEKAVAWILRNQNRGRDRRSHGGWGYFSPVLRPEDRFARASVTAWMVMALKSAQMSGLELPPTALADAEAYLWRMFDEQHGMFLYNREPSRLQSEWRTLPGSTPASVFCLLLLGADRDDQRLRAAAAWTLERVPRAYRRYSLDEFVLQAQGNVYYWYYGSLACFLAGGDVWAVWNEALKRVLLGGQSDDGSFRPIDEYADYAGDTDRDRAYTTAMCVLSLEVYYRYFTPLVQPR